MPPGLGPIRRCASCSTALGRADQRFGSSFGSGPWTDGRDEALLTPHQYLLIKCARCDALGWAEELEVLERPGGVIHPYFEPTFDDYLRVLSQTPVSRDRELYLRRRAWWAGNDKRRGSSTPSEIAPLEESNLRALADRLECSDEDQRLERAEIHRELREFDLAAELLDHGFAPTRATLAQQLRALVERRDAQVRVVWSAPLTQAQAEEPIEEELHSWTAKLMPVVKAHTFAGLDFEGLLQVTKVALRRALRVGGPALSGSIACLVRSELLRTLTARAFPAIGESDLAEGKLLRALLDARTALSDNNLDRAEQGYQHAFMLTIQLSPSSASAARALGGLGEVYRTRGHWGRARREFEAALLAPGGSDDALLLLRLGQVSMQLGDRARANDLLAEARRRSGVEIFADEDPQLLVAVDRAEKG